MTISKTQCVSDPKTMRVGERMFVLVDGEWHWLHPSERWGLTISDGQSVTMFSNGYATEADVSLALEAMLGVSDDLRAGRAR